MSEPEYQININSKRCKGCELCVENCPKDVLEISEKSNKMGYFPAQPNQEKLKYCTGCTFCTLMCADTAITIYRTI